MPGILGAIGVAPPVLDRLEEEAVRRWPSAVVQRGPDALLASHAHGGATPIFHLPNGGWMALDGEWALYREVRSSASDGVERASRVRGEFLEPDLQSVGNVALLDTQKRTLRLAVDATGTFPLYYGSLGTGLLFGSLLRPLALLAGAAADNLATLEFLRQAYTVGGKTVFKGFSRLLPGQSLTSSAGGPPRLHERSQAWVRIDTPGEGTVVAREAWGRLLASLDRGIPDANSALMMSGGWDSRTLLAGIQDLQKTIRGYSHGDVESRELSIVRRLCDLAGTPCQLEPIDDRVLETALLERGFERTETLVFPHWHRAGKLLSESGVEAVAAGVFGEILGGHYGPAMLQGPLAKVATIGSSLLGLPLVRAGWNNRSAREFLRVAEFGHHWYLDPAWEAELRDSRDRMNADVESAIGRLEARGVSGEIALVEAFISEHRGTQYINAQLLSCRANVDIALPFAGREIFSFSTQTALDAKVHNRLNRLILGAHAPHLLRAPMAATLVPAGWPVLLQEASRMGRKLYEGVSMAVHQRTRGKWPHPRLGWVNFDFLGKSNELPDLASTLSLNIWDHDRIRQVVHDLRHHRDPSEFHPIFDQFAKILTVDRMLRPKA